MLSRECGREAVSLLWYLHQTWMEHGCIRMFEHVQNRHEIRVISREFSIVPFHSRAYNILKHKVRTRAPDELPAPDNGIKEW